MAAHARETAVGIVIEALVERQQMACSAGGGKLYWRHVGTAHGVAGLQRSGFHREQHFLAFVSEFGVYVIWVGVGPGRCDGFRAMAIGTLHLDKRAVGAAADRLDVDEMV